ncbi:MAG: DUF6527 family protein [Patescibacteria group bacterium]
MIMIHKFVENIPDNLEEGTIYISIEYGTVVHKCCCGCGNEVVTPLSPTDWQLIFDGETISLYPSIGNWNFDCKSHYWIINDRIKWARKWSKQEIDGNRQKDSLDKKKYYSPKDSFYNKEIHSENNKGLKNLLNMISRFYR